MLQHRLVLQSRYQAGYKHYPPKGAGFMQQFAAVSSMAKPEENLAEVINQLSGGQDPNRVLCCGHSLGGALATLGEPCHTVPQLTGSLVML